MNIGDPKKYTANKLIPKTDQTEALEAAKRRLSACRQCKHMISEPPSPGLPEREFCSIWAKRRGVKCGTCLISYIALSGAAACPEGNFDIA